MALTPEKFNLKIREIRHTRNLLIFLGFIPIMMFFSFGVLTAIYRGEPAMSAIQLSMAITTLFINTIILFFINKSNTYLDRTAKIGLGTLASGMFAWMIFWWIQYEIILWIAGILALSGIILFFSRFKTSKLVKTGNISYYILMLLQPCLINVYGEQVMTSIIALGTVAYPMLASWAAVRWANSEFFKITNK